jgi:hypothetical protein
VVTWSARAAPTTEPLTHTSCRTRSRSRFNTVEMLHNVVNKDSLVLIDALAAQ